MEECASCRQFVRSTFKLKVKEILSHLEQYAHFLNTELDENIHCTSMYCIGLHVKYIATGSSWIFYLGVKTGNGETVWLCGPEL